MIAIAIEGHCIECLGAQVGMFPTGGHRREAFLDHGSIVGARLIAREERAHIHVAGKAAIVALVALGLLLEQSQVLAVVVAQGFLDHGVDGSIVVDVAQVLQLAYDLKHLVGGPQRAAATRVAIPAPAAVAHLQVVEAIDNSAVFGHRPLLVEQLIELRHAQGLAVGLGQPGRSQQRANLQILILGQHRHKHTVLAVLLPVINGLGHLGLRLGNAACQHLGIEAMGKARGHLVVVAVDGGQSREAVPHGVVAILQCEASTIANL